MRILLGSVSVLFAAVATGCGPIEAPPAAVDLRENPDAFAERFDTDTGRSRLLLILSPA